MLSDMRLFFALTMVLMTISASARQYEITQEHKDRAAEIVKQMTLEEKIAYVGGYNNWCIRAIDRLGLPEVRMADGPQGVRNNTKSTLYPGGVAAAATWDVDLIHQMGVSLGKDSRARGVHILLGPGVNIYRSPLCGRNFEYFGEDPYLSGEIAASYINGVQSQGVMACVKHFAGNNQEYARHSVSSDIDERTMHEIYFPAFEKAVKKGNVATIMTSYNLLNCVRTSESRYLNQEVLRDLWCFDGIVISDWRSCYSPVNLAYWGVDVEMPCPMAMEPALMKRLVEQGVIDERSFDRKCQNIIQTILAYEFDKRPQLDPSLPENNPECDAVAHEISRGAVVMLKNEDGFLPKQKGRFFVCGPNADRIVTGGGSGIVTPLVTSSVADAMQQVGKKVKATVFADSRVDRLENTYTDRTLAVKGVRTEIFANMNLEGIPVESYISDRVFLDSKVVEAHNNFVKDNMSSRHSFVYASESTDKYVITVNGNDGCRLFINGEKVVDAWGGDSWNNGKVEYLFESGKTYECVVEHFNRGEGIGLEMGFELPLKDKLASMAEDIRMSDCVVLCLGHNNETEYENADRTFELPAGQLDYLDEVLKYNENVVVVLNGGGGIEMASWIHKVKAVLMAWYPGQQGGLAVTEIITGKVSPSGKLPFSIEKTLADNPCYDNYYENVSRMRLPEINPYSRVEYREGIFIGYRGYEKNNVSPLFPFGFGMSYTTFKYSDLDITPDGKEFVVSFNVKNVGSFAGAEVAQVYVGDDECRLVRPKKELKGFDKVYLKPGESTKVCVRLDEEAFRYYDPIERRFIVDPGTFTVHVGASSADIRMTGKLEVK
jgi:beta-glucosidase